MVPTIVMPYDVHANFIAGLTPVADITPLRRGNSPNVKAVIPVKLASTKSLPPSTIVAAPRNLGETVVAWPARNKTHKGSQGTSNLPVSCLSSWRHKPYEYTLHDQLPSRGAKTSAPWRL